MGCCGTPAICPVLVIASLAQGIQIRRRAAGAANEVATEANQSGYLRCMPRTLLLSPERVRRTLERLAYEVVERNRGAAQLSVFGIRRRGLALAERIAHTIAEIEDREVLAHALDVTAFRDDRRDQDAVAPVEAEVSVEDRDVLLVDDVLFTGRTARAAIEAVLTLGRPRSIQLAVLVDRGHREYPIRPDYVGCTFPTKHRERVVVEVADAVAVYLDE